LLLDGCGHGILQDGQDEPDKRLRSIWRVAVKYGDLTHEIIGACFEVSRELGSGFLESIYENALVIALQDRGLAVQRQVPLSVQFRGHVVGQFQADMVVENAIILELKAVARITPQHKAQLINYLNATGLDVGLLLNFGTPKLQLARCRRGGETDMRC
jgi:GxxExxY protein